LNFTFNNQTQPTIAQLKSNSVPWGFDIIDKSCRGSNEIDGRIDFVCDYSNGGPGQPINILVVGDSHAQQLVPTVLSAFESKNLHLTVFGRTGCIIGGIMHSSSPKSDQYCLTFWQTKVQLQFANTKFDYVLASDLGQTFAIQSKITAMKFLKTLTPNLILFSPTPKYPPFKSCLAQGNNVTNCVGTPSESILQYSKLAPLVGAAHFPISDFLCAGRKCPPIIHNNFVQMGDGGHLSGATAKDLAEPLRLFLNIA
jgi:hypothetical protein